MQWESNDGGYMEGGYMESQAVGSQKQGGNSRDNQTLTPVTVRQLLVAMQAESSDDVIHVDGKEINNVHIVGLLSDVSQNSTNITFMINDGTGQISGRLFLQAEDDHYQQQLTDSLRDGVYVSAFGNLRSYNGKTSLTCFAVNTVDNFNQITHHFSECIYTHLRNLHGVIGGGVPTPVKQDPGFGAPANTYASFGMSTNAGYGSHQSTYQNFAATDSSFSDPGQQAILDILGASTLEMGLSIDQIKSSLNGRLNDAQLREALGYLTNEGHIYSTIDENHFKRTA
ncbi:replication protein A 32 kDa subunit [Thraustotheca clavata]|uniref:Replication protein A 32 kDa subunit n=1 Tax=Thraustotheca clavata TaxID=74557 RepID=A0A1V9ZD32_9STRA|nr:replication protein A 32 kDa subunit [Thraustotheca clavata]